MLKNGCNSKSTNTLILRSVYFSILTATTITIAKIVAWFFTDSSAVIASLIDSALDLAASLIILIAVKYAVQPPDSEHRFGHGKAEDIAVAAQSAFFVLSGLFVMVLAIRRIILQQYITHTGVGIAIMLFSIGVTILLLIYQSYVAKKTQSHIVKADRFHYCIDLFSSMSVILSLYLSELLHSKVIDPIIAILLSIYMLHGATKLAKRSISNLMDEEFEEKERKVLHQIIRSHKEIKGFHDLKTRYAGRTPIIQFHIELDGNMTLHRSHKIAENVTRRVRKAFPDADIIIHQDPDDEKRPMRFIN